MGTKPVMTYGGAAFVGLENAFGEHSQLRPVLFLA